MGVRRTNPQSQNIPPFFRSSPELVVEVLSAARELSKMVCNVHAVVNEGEGEARAKKFPTLECYESGEVRDGMKKK